MRIAIIGCGNIANVHAWALSHMDSIDIVGFADCRIEKANKLSEQYTDGKAKTYENYLEMIEDINPDCVHICTPHYLHVPMAEEALKRDVSVFMEKPPAITKDEFEELKKVAGKSKATIGFCFQNRYNATTSELDKIVSSGELGNVIGVRGFVTWKREADYYSDEWHGNLEKEGGGVLINQSIHTLDLMLRYLGEPITVDASMQNHHLKDVIEVEDTLEAWLEFENDKRASFYATTAYSTDAPVIIELTFEKGRATMIDQNIQIKTSDNDTKIITCEPPKDGVGKSYWGRGHLDCIKDFYDCMYSGSEYRNNLNGVSNTLYTTMKVYESARSKTEREDK